MSMHQQHALRHKSRLRLTATTFQAHDIHASILKQDFGEAGLEVGDTWMPCPTPFATYPVKMTNCTHNIYHGQLRCQMPKQEALIWRKQIRLAHSNLAPDLRIDKSGKLTELACCAHKLEGDRHAGAADL